MGCIPSSFKAEVLGIKFTYEKLWKSTSAADENITLTSKEETLRYENIYVDTEVRFSKTTLVDDYPLVLHFTDMNTLMFFRGGAAVVIFMEEGASVSSAIVPWFQSTKFRWIFPRLHDVTHEQAVSHLAWIRKFHDVELLKNDSQMFQMTAMTTQADYYKQSENILDQRGEIDAKYNRNTREDEPIEVVDFT